MTPPFGGVMAVGDHIDPLHQQRSIRFDHCDFCAVCCGRSCVCIWLRSCHTKSREIW